MDNNIAQSSNEYYDGNSIPLDKNYALDEYQPPEFDYDAYNTRNIKPEKVNIASVEKSIFKNHSMAITWITDYQDLNLLCLELHLIQTRRKIV